jgi:hypothetical protein
MKQNTATLRRAVAAPPEHRPAETLPTLLEQAMIDSKVKIFPVRVSPELAEMLLGNNTGNRPLKERVLQTYERDMAAGNFDLTGETIILDEHWKLLNGQHRLNACIRAKKSFPALIVQGGAGSRVPQAG